jgi:hypothetical protein
MAAAYPSQAAIRAAHPAEANVQFPVVGEIVDNGNTGVQVFGPIPCPVKGPL